MFGISSDIQAVLRADASTVFRYEKICGLEIRNKNQQIKFWNQISQKHQLFDQTIKELKKLKTNLESDVIFISNYWIQSFTVKS